MGPRGLPGNPGLPGYQGTMGTKGDRGVPGELFFTVLKVDKSLYFLAI